MKMSNKSPTVTIALPTPLFLIFLVLKLTGVIDWSWVWVTAPLWIPLVIFAGIFLFLAAIAVMTAVLK
jgi:hypothetical protein